MGEATYCGGTTNSSKGKCIRKQVNYATSDQQEEIDATRNILRMLHIRTIRDSVVRESDNRESRDADFAGNVTVTTRVPTGTWYPAVRYLLLSFTPVGLVLGGTGSSSFLAPRTVRRGG